MDGSRGRPSESATRRTRKRDVRGAVLALLSERPMTGSEMIDELSTRSAGDWQPSATSIYPMLQLLEDDALVTSAQSPDGKRRYELTAAGRDEAERQAAAGTTPWEPPGQAATDLVAAIAEAARVLMGAATKATEQQRAQLVGLLNELRQRITAIVPDAGESEPFGTFSRRMQRERPSAGWSINIPDWIFGAGGPFGSAGGGGWWQPGGPAETGRDEAADDEWDDDDEGPEDEATDL